MVWSEWCPLFLQSRSLFHGENPQATIQKAETIQRAALAPANPSGPDRRVTAQAAALATKARQEVAQQSQEITTREKNLPQIPPPFS